GEILGIIAFRPDIITARRDELRAMRRAWDKALAYAKAHPQEADTIMGKIEGITPQEFAEELADIKTLSISEQQAIMAPGGPFERTLIKVHELLHKQGQLKESDIKANDFLVRLDDTHP